MKWTEKISKLLEGKNAAQLSLGVGLHKRAIRDAVSTGQLPRVDKALKFARAMGVSVEWLFDDGAEWPPPSTIAAAVDDFEIAEEIGRRRHLMIQDMKALTAQFLDPEKVQRLEAIAKRYWTGSILTMDSRQVHTLQTAQLDLQRCRLLERRLEMLSETTSGAAERPPPISQLLMGCEWLSHTLTMIPTSSDLAVMPDYPRGEVTPVFNTVGVVIDRKRYSGLGLILQRRFVPIIEDVENGPPAEKPLLIYLGQSVPTRFNQFVRCDVDSGQAFGFCIRDDAAPPSYQKGSVVVCQPGEPDRSGKVPALCVYDRGRKTGIFIVSGDHLVTAGGQTLKLRSGDQAAVYPIVAGPFQPVDEEGHRAEKSEPRGKK